MTSTMLAMFLLGTITFLYRYSFISPFGKKLAEKIPPELLQMLAPATFAAIIANNLLNTQHSASELKQKLLISLFSLIVAYVTKNILATLVFGLLLLYVIQNCF